MDARSLSGETVYSAMTEEIKTMYDAVLYCQFIGAHRAAIVWSLAREHKIAQRDSLDHAIAFSPAIFNVSVLRGLS